MFGSGTETVKGYADWPNPKIDKDSQSQPGEHDFGLIRTRAEVHAELRIADQNDFENVRPARSPSPPFYSLSFLS